MISKASPIVFTLNRNMLSLIMNEPCFTMETVHIRRGIVRIVMETRSKRDRNYLMR